MGERPYYFLYQYIQLLFPFSDPNYNIYVRGGKWTLNSRLTEIINMLKSRGQISDEDIELLKLSRFIPRFLDYNHDNAKFLPAYGPGKHGNHYISQELLKDSDSTSYLTSSFGSYKSDPIHYGNKLIASPFMIKKESVILMSDIRKFKIGVNGYLNINYAQIIFGLNKDLDESLLSPKFLDKIVVMEDSIRDLSLNIDLLPFSNPELVKEELIEVMSRTHITLL
jgi:hypothetical protein